MTVQLPKIRDVLAVSPPPAAATKGSLAGHKVTVHHPEFGESCERRKPEKWQHVLKIVVAVAVPVLIGAVVGFFVGGPVGAIIGAMAGIGAVGFVAIAKVISDHVSQKQFLRQLPEEGSHHAKLPADAAKTGKYYEASIRLTEKADCGLEWKKALIESAQESIELSVNFAGGTVYREVLALIDKKMTQNERVKTHMIASVDLLESADKEALARMQEKFGDRLQVLVTDRHYKIGFDFHSEENHVKMLVVDGKYFVAGGTGIHPRLSREVHDPENDVERPTAAARLLDPSSKDADIVGESKDIAQAMRDQFFNLYRLWEARTTSTIHDSRYFELKGPAGHCQKFIEDEGLLKKVRMKFLVGGPEHRGNNAIVNQYAKRISKATSEIRIANWMFCPTKKLRQALMNNEKAKRIAYLNGIGNTFSIGRLSQTHSGRGHYHLVDKVYEYRGHRQIYHKKVATFDKSHMIIGSFNLGKKSAKFDHEIAFVIKDKEITNLCRNRLKDDRLQSKKVDIVSTVHKAFIPRVVSFIFAKATQNFI